MHSLLSCLIFCSFFVTYATAETIAVATPWNNPPHTYSSKEGVQPFIVAPGSNPDIFQGYSWDILRESLHAVNVTIELIPSNWARAVRNLETKRADALFPTGMNSQRLKKYSYSENPVHKINILYYSKEKIHLIQSIDDIKDERIAIIRGYNYGEKINTIIRQHNMIINTKGTLQAFRLLQKGRVDGYIGYEKSTDYYLKDQKPKLNLHKSQVLDTAHEYFTTLKTERGSKFIQLFDKGYETIKSNGKLEEINKKWKSIISEENKDTNQ